MNPLRNLTRSFQTQLRCSQRLFASTPAINADEQKIIAKQHPKTFKPNNVKAENLKIALKNMGSVVDNLKSVLDRIDLASKTRTNNTQSVTLVAVSKKKTVEDIIEAYNAGQRHFGENYVQELEEKANSEKILSQCPDIKWHFIGHLQSNKAKKVANLPNLYAIETVDSKKLAELLDNFMKTKDSKLNVMIQVNTSLEPQKSGIPPEELVEFFKTMKESLSNLNVLGLMTIGSYEASTSGEINKDFQSLLECKNDLVAKLEIPPEHIALSMGMSHDFETAIEMGSTFVRVGSLVFGAR